MNIQTLPRGEKVIKQAFVPKLDAFVSADYPNIELKLLAFYLESIGWPSMAEVFRAGADLHRETASALLGVPPMELTDKQRQIGKVLNFSIVYGGGIPTLVKQLACPAPEALELLRNYHAKWPGIGWESKRRPADPGTLIAFIKEQVARRTTPTEPGYITTLYGRHLHPESMHKALNALCQGCAADLMKWAMVRVDHKLWGSDPGWGPQYQSHIVNTVHDELVLDVTRDEIPWVVSELPAWMTDDRIEAVVPIRPACEVSYTTLAEKEAV